MRVEYNILKRGNRTLAKDKLKELYQRVATLDANGKPHMLMPIDFEDVLSDGEILLLYMDNTACIQEEMLTLIRNDDMIVGTTPFANLINKEELGMIIKRRMDLNTELLATLIHS